MGLSGFNRAREKREAEQAQAQVQFIPGPTKEQLRAEFEAAYAADMAEYETVDEPVKAKKGQKKA